MNGNRFYGVRLEGAKYGVGFGSALAIAISYTTNHSILWAIIHKKGLKIVPQANGMILPQLITQA
jgi:hypothetical protein